MNKIIICPNEEKLNILNKLSINNTLHNYKFMTINEFIDNYYFTYNNDALYYLMNKYNYDIDVCKVYLSNLYYIDINKKYKNKKLSLLQQLKQELINNNLLVFNNAFKAYIKGKEIEVINYYDLDKYQEKILGNIEIPNTKLNTKVYEFKSIEEELNFVCIEIIKLLNKGIDINKIYLSNVTEEYNYILSKIFSYYKIPININFKDSIFSTPTVKEYLNTNKLDLENESKITINKKIINIIKDIPLDDNISKKILIDKLKNTYIPNTKLMNAVNVKDLDKYTFNDDEYVFVLGFNLDSLPKTYKDINYLTDKDKEEVELYDTLYLNRREKEKIRYLLSRIKNLTISYKLSSPFQKYYPSNLINDLNLEVIKNYNSNLNYSNTYNKILLGEYLDNYNLYGEINDNLKILNSNYDINYNSYSNQYRHLYLH